MEPVTNVDIPSKAWECICEMLTGGTKWVSNVFFEGKVAKNLYIEEIEKSGLPLETKVALISNAEQIVREFKNKFGILKKACEYVSSEAKPNNLDRDWFYSFVDKCRNVSKEEIQDIWARLLAGEINSPGSVSIRTLNCLQGISAEEAKLFKKYTKYVIAGDGILHITQFGETNDVKYDEIVLLDECGFIKMTDDAVTPLQDYSYVINDLGDFVVAVRCNQVCDLSMSQKRCLPVEIQCYPLTIAGKQLYKIAKATNDIDVYHTLVTTLRGMYTGYKFGIYPVLHRQDSVPVLDWEHPVF